MTIDTDKLKALALAATPGKWVAENDERANDDSEYWRIESEYGTICGDEGIWWPPVEGSNEGNAKWIAAACPATVLALIAERDELRAEVERLRVDAGRYRWLRDRARLEYDERIFVTNDGHKDYYAPNAICESELDDAVDAAIAAKEPPCSS